MIKICYWLLHLVVISGQAYTFFSDINLVSFWNLINPKSTGKNVEIICCINSGELSNPIAQRFKQERKGV